MAKNNIKSKSVTSLTDLYKYNELNGTAYYLFKSDDVEVFPCAYRGIKLAESTEAIESSEIFDPEARLLTEANWIKANTNSLNDTYLINWAGSLLECVIAGYRFKINLNYSEFLNDNLGKEVYLKVKLAEKELLNANGRVYKTKVLDSQYELVIGGLDTYIASEIPVAEETSRSRCFFTGVSLVVTSKPDQLTLAENEYMLKVLGTNAELVLANYLPKIASGSGSTSVVLNAKTENKHGSTTDNLKTVGNRASGECATVANSAVASGKNATAINEAEADAENSFAAGEGTRALGKNQTVIGQFNKDSKNEALFIVGNGIDNASRSNALEITKTGEAIVKTKVKSPTFEGDLSGNALTATNLETPQNISISGDITASAASFTGTQPVTLSANINDDAVHSKHLNADVINTGAQTANGISISLSQEENGKLKPNISSITVEKATGDESGNNIKNTYVKSVTLANSTTDSITITKGNGTANTVKISDVEHATSASSAAALDTEATFKLSGNVTSSGVNYNGTGDVTLQTTIEDGVVTNAMLAGSITKDKIASIPVASANTIGGIKISFNTDTGELSIKTA